MNTEPKYAIVTPVRNEEAHLAKTIASVLGQTVLPAEWVIVNDGSADRTGSIVEDAAAKCDWLHVIHREDRGYRKSGGGVVDAFNDGLRELQCQDWEFLVKLDGDLSFESDYFERCFEAFRSDPKLGIAGGSIHHIVDGKQVLEECPKFHVRGATKIYRRACWEALGGLTAVPGWDTLDEIKANMNDWQTRTLANLELIHHRQTGTAEGIWRGLVKNGRGSYVCGYHPLFMAAKCVKRLVQWPYVIGSFALAYGFITGYLKDIPRVDDANLIRFVRTQQMLRLMGRGSVWQ